MKDVDEKLAAIRDTLPRLWWALYVGALEAGFSNSQAMTVVTTYILSQNPIGIRPDGPAQPTQEE